ncbi:MAG: hypothetical protein DRP85_07265 [Candidatus Makaraimicrobium thalassicum]|nr:MAG: hypothetical protein DRP85_07265 [Candidatus Omnitrophota bacterium]
MRAETGVEKEGAREMRLLRTILVMLVSIGVIFSSVHGTYADQTSDLILKLLVKKGIVTQKEVDELKAEVAKAKIGAPEVGEPAERAGKPEWTERIKLKGDIRLRNEYQRPGSGTYVNRQRIRARVGLEAGITDTVTGAVALATGGVGNARSTNQTLTDAFGTKAFDLDKAYIDWKPYKFIHFTGGKYANPLYHPSNLLWDGDLRFEGASTNVKYPLRDGFGIPLDVMANAGIFVLDDLAIDKKNPFLYAVQGGLGSSVGDILEWKGYIGYLDFAKIKGTTSNDLVPTTGRADPAGYYYYDYNILELSGETTFHFLEQNLPAPWDKPLTLFGDYAQNLSAGDKRHAWELGLKFGEKPRSAGAWRALYNFRWFERDAFPDEFPDADFFRGRTDGYGHKFGFSYGLWKNIRLDFAYFLFRDKTQGADPNDKWGQVLQADLNIIF